LFDDFLADLRKPKVDKYPWMDNVELILGTAENLPQAIEECMAVEVYGADIETTGLDNRVFEGRTVDSIVGIQLAPNESKAYYFPVGHKVGSEYNISWSIVGKEFGRLFHPDTKAKPVFHNIAFDSVFLEYNGFFPLGVDRWDDHKKWEDSLIIKYLLNPRQKGGRGLKALSDELCDMKMIELNQLIPDSPIKDYSQLDPSWGPSVWYAAADPLCTLRVWNILFKQYTDAPEHTMSIYNLEKMCNVATSWMHRSRVYIDREKAISSCVEGQQLWWDSLLEVYDGASKILGRNVAPNYLRIMKGKFKGAINVFDPQEVGTEDRMSYKVRVDEARKEAKRNHPDPIQKISKNVPLVGKEAGSENVDFPMTYDVLSAQQLGLLFRELKIPNLIASEKSGQVVTKAEVLDDVISQAEEEFPFMSKIKNLRFLSKALGQYLIPFVEDVGYDGTLKPRFDQFAADTGRFSCKSTSKPWKVKDGGCRVPFQGIPAYGKDAGKKPAIISYMRDCITSRDDKWWLAAIDYAGVELRLVTNLSREPLWIKAFFECSDCGNQFPREMNEDDIPKATPTYCSCGSDRIGDLHTITATAFYGENAKNLPNWKDLRGNGKGCNFALCYGGTGKAVQRTIGCSQKEGDDKYRKFTSTYKTLASWWGVQHRTARKNGYVKTAFGRVQPLPDINSDDFRKKSKDERKALNGPVQGTSADITKLAMSLIYKEVKKRGWLDKLKMILTVHDEIVFEIHEDIIGEAIPILTNVMSRNKGIANQGWEVPLLVDVEIGKTWGVPYDLKDLKRGYKEKFVADGVDDGGKKKYKEVKIDVPASLYEIFGEEVAVESVAKEPQPITQEVPKFILQELCEEKALELAIWLSTNENGVVEYNGRNVTALFS
jgi:DNA polymerase I-like protein with 3'-5' exonuclease and polymerase domains